MTSAGCTVGKEGGVRGSAKRHRMQASDFGRCGVSVRVQIGVLEKMPEGKKGGRRITKQGQQDCDRIAKEIWESKNE